MTNLISISGVLKDCSRLCLDTLTSVTARPAESLPRHKALTVCHFTLASQATVATRKLHIVTYIILYFDKAVWYCSSQRETKELIRWADQLLGLIGAKESQECVFRS